VQLMGLYVTVPIASFRASYARELLETLPCPPPATVYGMLLSLVGEANRFRHEGAEIAVGLLNEPDVSLVLRTFWRVKNRKQGLGQGGNRTPDFQELLTNLKIAVWVREGLREDSPTLVARLKEVVANPGAANRFGGLSLGESTHLVNEVKLLSGTEAQTVLLLTQDREGILSLPIWSDHVGSVGTVWGQYRLVTHPLTGRLPEEVWTTIGRRGVN